uniref:Small ribosomal subunit protein mS25 n=2 Tax=Hirondellea gigas TaxID=1518452 RepID=A0A2P2I203_9CRUS
MPFMKGPAPVRRTLKYLENFHIKLKSRVEVLSIHYNNDKFLGGIPAHHVGAEQFVFWNLPQLQYKNPEVQMLTFKNLTPSPFIRIFCKDGEEILIDLDGKTNTEIVAHLHKVIGKKVEDSEPASRILHQLKENPAHFGWGCKRQCMCEIFGQLPCPGIVPMPKRMRGKYRYNPELIQEEIEEWAAEDEAEAQALLGGDEDEEDVD